MGLQLEQRESFLSMIGIFKEIPYVGIPQILLLDVSAILGLNSEKGTIKNYDDAYMSLYICPNQ